MPSRKARDNKHKSSFMNNKTHNPGLFKSGKSTMATDCCLIVVCSYSNHWELLEMGNDVEDEGQGRRQR